MFFVAWGVVLVLWALPLLMFEFALGRAARSGPLGGFAWVFGRRAAWRGAFLSVVALALLAETTVRGARAFDGAARLVAADDAVAPHGDRLVVTASAWALLLGVIVATRGLGTREAFTRRVVPAVFVALLVTAVWSWTRPGAEVGLARLVEADWSRLGQGGLWWDALAQASWSTGAGLGLMLLHARSAGRGMQARRESFATAVGVSVAGLLAALATVPLLSASSAAPVTLAAFVDGEAGLVASLGPAFGDASAGGRWVGAVFFAAVGLAATTSVLAIVALLVRTVRDRGGATAGWVFAAALAALSLAVYVARHDVTVDAERWVWRVGIVAASGLLTLSVVGHGANRFWIELIGGPEGRFAGGGGFRFVAGVVLPLLVLVLVVGHLRGALDGHGADWGAWFSPGVTRSLGACVTQWGLATVALKLALR